MQFYLAQIPCKYGYTEPVHDNSSNYQHPTCFQPVLSNDSACLMQEALDKHSKRLKKTTQTWNQVSFYIWAPPNSSCKSELAHISLSWCSRLYLQPRLHKCMLLSAFQKGSCFSQPRKALLICWRKGVPSVQRAITHKEKLHNSLKINTQVSQLLSHHCSQQAGLKRYFF